MKNAKKLLIMLTLSMMIPVFKTFAMEMPSEVNNTTKTTSQEAKKTQDKPNPEVKLDNKAKPDANSDDSENIFAKFGNFWENTTVSKKTFTGAGIGLGSILTLWICAKTLKFVPGICKLLIPVVGLAGGLLYLNNMASKPENKDFKSTLEQIQIKVVEKFTKAKNWFAGIFS